MVLRIGIVKQNNQEFISTGAHSVFSRNALRKVTILMSIAYHDKCAKYHENDFYFF